MQVIWCYIDFVVFSVECVVEYYFMGILCNFEKFVGVNQIVIEMGDVDVIVLIYFFYVEEGDIDFFVIVEFKLIE